jgi:hypothetical protein
MTSIHSEPRDPIKEDFRNLLYLIWRHLGLPDPTEVQYDIAYNLQNGPKRMIVEAFRGVGKSWITSAFVCWLLLCNPQIKILVVSASKQRADDFSTFVKRLIHEMPMLQHLKAKDGQRDSNIAFDVGPSMPAHAPSVKSIGITGQIAGSRADVIIPDDIEVPNNSLTQMMRDKLATSVKEFDAVLTPKPASRILYLGTPQTEFSVYNQLVDRGYTMFIWPARYPNATLQGRYAERLAPYIAERLEKNPALVEACDGRGAPTDPARFSDFDLIEREASYGRSGFAMQFMLDTSSSDSDRYPLKLSDLVIMGLSGELAPVTVTWGSGPDQIIKEVSVIGLQGDRYHRPIFHSKDFLEYQGTVMTIDPAGRGGDELAYAVVSMLNGNLYLRDCVGLKGGYSDENLRTLAEVAKKFNVKKIIVESNFGDGMFTKLLTPFLTRIYPCTTEEIHSSVQKEKRIIDTLEPVMNQHRLIVDERLIKKDGENYNGYALEHAHKYQLFYQMTRITRERGAIAKDDRLDALAMAVAYWVETMDKDVQKAQDEHRAAALDKELAKFATQVFGYTPPSSNWMNI